MYVRDLDLDPRLDLSRIEEVLQAKGRIRETALGAGYIKSFALGDFLDVAMAGLNANPLWLLKERR
jgi:aminoglycoside N3'-acetyltransferase